MPRAPESRTVFWRSSWCGGRGCWWCSSRVRFMETSLPLGGEGVLSSPRYYSAVRSHQAVRTTGLPLTQERRAGPIARVTIVAILAQHFNMAAKKLSQFLFTNILEGKFSELRLYGVLRS